MLILYILFILAPTELERCQIIKYSVYHQMLPVLNQVLTANFFLVFLCTIDCQQSNLVCSHNDTLSCSCYMVLFISSFPGTVIVMCLVIPAAACLLILCSLGAIIIAQWAQ